MIRFTAKSQARLAEQGGIVYGGGKVGLMGAVADAALQHGGSVIGVIPQSLVAREIAHTGLTHLHVVANIHEQKMKMAELADAFIALPGGTGTLEEILNCHIHLSWTTGGINAHGNWKAMSFDLPKVRSRWMWNVRQLLLEAWDSLTLPPSLAHLQDYDEWKRFVLSQGKNEKGEDYCHVYFAKPTKHARQTAKYLGR